MLLEKKLSGAEYRKRAKDRAEQEKQIAAKMRKWLHVRGEPSEHTATSDDAEILEDVNYPQSLNNLQVIT